MVLLLGLTQVFSQTATTNTYGARQCVECIYWGGNWCPKGTASSLTVSNGGCASTVITSCTSGYSLKPSDCVQVSGHAVKTKCSMDLNLTSDTYNATRTVTFSKSLAAYNYCQLDLTVIGNTNASVSYTFSSTGGTVVVQTAKSDYSEYITNVTTSAKVG